MSAVEARCPTSGRLLGKITVADDPGGSTFEIACRDCRVALNDAGRRTAMVIHIWNGEGRLTDTLVVPAR